jgi:hypothetical protein
MLTLAAAVYLGGPLLTDWRRIVLIAGLVALAPVFRRPFAYGSAALLVTMVAHILIGGVLRLRHDPRSARPAVVLSGIGLAMIVGLALSGLWLFARPFVDSVLAIDFGALYASYGVPAGDVLAWSWTAVGPLAWVLAAAGLAWAAASHDGNGRAAVAFVALQGLFGLAAWVLVAGQVNAHYAYQFLPAVAAGLGLAAHGLYARARRAGARLAVAAVAAAIGVGGLGLTLASPGLPALASVAGALPASAQPLVRTDLAELDRLVGHLRAATPGRPIYVIASSFVINGEVVRQAERQRFADADPVLAILPAPEIDSRDAYPVSTLALAEVVVLAEPFQHHLPPAEQRVVRAAFDAFVDGWEISRDFEREPATFRLETGVEVSVLRRTRPTPIAVIRRTLDQVEAAVARRPGGQPDWVVARADSAGLALRRDPGGTDTLTARIEAGGAAGPVLLSDRPGARQVRGRVSFGDPACPGIAIVLREHRPDGSLLAEHRVVRRPSDPGTFEIGLSRQRFDFVTVEVRRPDDRPASSWPSQGCQITIDSIAIRTTEG